MKSYVKFKNNKPYIDVDGKLHAPLAYTTYFEERSEHADFIKSGYKMFFVNVSFTDLPINNVTGFTPFETGVFEGDIPDYADFDNKVRGIISKCPHAMIFPRINIAMPRKWIEDNPYETVDTPKGKRESLYSDLFWRDGAELLRKLVSHIRSEDYSESIAGYQVCGGTTQEWMHHDMFGSFSDMGFEKFRLWMKEKHGENDVPYLSREDFTNEEYKSVVRFYGEFCCEYAAKTVEFFSKKLKEFINNEQIVGVFYGYSAFVNDPLLGLHGLRFIIDSPYIDFFSSPCGYDNGRSLGIDWGDMLPSESVKLHGKLYFVECDIRTCLTRKMQDSRPGKYPDDIYTLEDEKGNKTVWCGPATQELSLSAIRKAFVHQLTNSSGIWWFDMWGGWYHNEHIMSEIEKMRNIAQAAENKNPSFYPTARTVMFIDEKAYLNNPRGSHLCHSVNITRINMGNTGIPFDLCMVEDAQKVIHKYRAAIFTAPLSSKKGKEAVDLCKKNKIPYIQTSVEKCYYSETELRDFLVSSGIHCFNSDGNVIWCSEGFLGIHSVAESKIKITLPSIYTVKPLLGTDFTERETQEIMLDMKKHDTAVFELLSNGV